MITSKQGVEDESLSIIDSDAMKMTLRMLVILRRHSFWCQGRVQMGGLEHVDWVLGHLRQGGQT